MKNNFTFMDLKWDTEFFGVKCAKATLHNKLSLKDWEYLISKFKEYDFISIVNENSQSQNSQWIGKHTNSYLIDVNIQFKKKIEKVNNKPEEVKVYNNLKRNNQILKLANFSHSKFVEDPELAKRGGSQVYSQWIINSFEREDKFFALSFNEKQIIDGFSLFSFHGKNCVIELIAVSHKYSNRGIGKSIFKAIEFECSQKNVYEIKVGTQVKNHSAINFYQKVGCKQIGSHQVYHLWNRIK